MSRWLELYATSPSGKTLFVCRMCGRISPTPDRECSALPQVCRDKFALSCMLLEEIENALEAVGEAHVPRTTRMWLSKIGNHVSVQWESSPGNMKRTQVIIKEHKENTNLSPVLLRTPEGSINNCSLSHGEKEADCQVCGGKCPDRNRYK
jgi:hypothetical protein